MDAERRAEITGWDAREFSDGFAGLRRLVDRGFSGAVTNGTGWLFVFEGRVVGTAGADLDAFADASGTIYKAPAEVLPVLFAMQERGGEPRAQYYTNDTPLSEADRKLSQGGFTGYVELSENVLSGDYYVTYTAGESMAAAYVGNSRRLETGDDAFELADDEVGIYTVYEVDLNVREIPDSGSAGGATAAEGEAADEDGPDGDATNDDASNDDAAGEEESVEDRSVRDEPAESDVAERGITDGAETADDEPVRDATPDEEPTDGAARGGEQTPREASTRSDEASDPPRERAGEPNGSRPTTDAVEGAEAAAEPDPSTGDASSDAPSAADAADAADASTADPEGDRPDEDVFSEEEQWREQKSIPALDPSEASDPRSGRRPGKADPNPDRSGDAGSAAPDDDRSPEPRSTDRSRSNRSAVSQRGSGSGRGARADEQGGDRVERLRSELEAAEEKRASLAAERDKLATDRDEIAAERDDLESEVERLESELSTLREERDRLKSELSSARDRLPESDRSISPTEARSGTNLFVRYESKGGATLEDAHDGTVDRDALRENLRIEHHTSFETDGLVVDGRPYDEFLEDTIEYGFTRWLVEDLPFEVSGTGNQGVLRDLYDAIPEIDRAEIGGSVSIAIRENGEETREQRSFDLVLRDRMGNPLFVADLNDSRDPTAEGTLESLVENGRDIAESNEPFAAAFAVTESFFEPGALETASDAVGGGLFSRSKRASFVKLSRKQGYHLCLVEARDGGFHMTVPDL
ncbi:hypothetical protein [Halorubrum sp. CSM-61]|uniref:DUF7527 domain-containing protein n=1 Tax=Halorubrum sp. CSM-61 TaxID=2485838 RepID=UPI000F4C34B7|nr:hypothetical protein [Halorubrum sp. CSM-61]